MKKSLSICAALLFMPGAAFASEASDKAAGIACIEAGDFVKILGKLDKLKPKQIDTVGMSPIMQLKAIDGGALPSRVYHRYNGAETPFHLDADGYVTDFTNIKTMHKKGDMCMEDKTRIGADDDEDRLSLNIDMDLSFHNTSGVYTMAELKDGLKDGRAHIKKIVPGPVSLIIPKFTHLSIETADDVSVDIAAYKEGAALSGLTVLNLEGTQIVSYKQLKTLGADSLRITGGAYTMGPMPSPDDVKNLQSEDE